MNYYPFYQEKRQHAPQIADWFIGMQASLVYTLNLQPKGVTGTFSLGVVQRPPYIFLFFQAPGSHREL